jgi:hypothetical protein
VVTQDGQAVAQYSGAVCPFGFFGGGGMQIDLPHDPTSPGNALVMYSCSFNTISDVATATTRVVTSAISCPVNYPYYSTTWNGTLTYNYVLVQVRCRLGWCNSFVNTNGSGETSAPPPPPPPPPPKTVSFALGAGTCDANSVCTLNPTDTSVITSAHVGMYSWQLTIDNADGTQTTINLDTLSIRANGDDGGSYIATGSGTVYDANGRLVESVDFTLNLTLDSSQNLAVSSGTLDITTPAS